MKTFTRRAGVRLALLSLLLAGGACGQDAPTAPAPEPPPAAAPPAAPPPATPPPEAGARRGGPAGKLGRGHKGRSGKAGKAGKAGSGGPQRQSTGLAMNNAQSLLHVGADLLTLYRDQGQALLVRAGGQPLTVATENIAQIAMDSAGDAVMVVFTRGGGLYATLSEDGGAHFSEAWTVASGERHPQGPAVRLWRSAGALRAVVSFHTSAMANAYLYSARWVDGTWELPERLEGPGGAGSFAALAGAGDWTLAVWKDYRGGSEPSLYAAELTESWGTPRALGIPGADPSLCMDGQGRLYMAFQQEPRTVKLTHSDDRGLSWSEPRALDSRPGLFARVTCNTRGDVAVTWESFTADGGPKDDRVKAVGLAVSRDRGEHFERIPINDDQLDQTRPTALLREDGSVELAWVDMRGAATIRWATIAP